jgi:hypothetical protein
MEKKKKHWYKLSSAIFPMRNGIVTKITKKIIDSVLLFLKIKKS